MIAYRRGGLQDIIEPRETGYLVEPGDVNGLVKAIAKLDAIDRYQCRAQVEAHHSLESWGTPMEAWLLDVINSFRYQRSGCHSKPAN